VKTKIHRRWKKRNLDYYLAVSVSLLTFIVYLASLQNEFVAWDDPEYITNNPYIRLFGLDLFRWAFSAFYSANWHPLTWISHALDYAVWGLNPLGHHLTNNILHAVNTFLVVLLVARLIEATTPPPPCQVGELVGDKSSPTVSGGVAEGRGGKWNEGLLHHSLFTFHISHFSLIAAGVTGLLFGLHPLHVESVAWVSERKDLLCAMFFLLSIMMYAKYVVTTSTTFRQVFNKHYLFSLCFFFLALLSKPMAVSLPVVLLILDWHPFGRVRSLKTFWPAVVEKLPFVVLSLISSVLTILAQKGSEALFMMEVTPLSSRGTVAAKSLVAYLGKIMLPLHLSPFYPYPLDVTFFSMDYLLPFFLVIGITILCLGLSRKQKMYLSAWSFYVVTLVPVLGIVQVGRQSMADRYTYLPSLGPFLVIGLGVAWVLTRTASSRQHHNSCYCVCYSHIFDLYADTHMEKQHRILEFHDR
jgi:protein O-mannosyl-transferase